MVSPTNFVFTDGQPSRSYVAELERRAVLWALMPAVRGKPPNSELAKRAIIRMICEWRDRVAALRQYGWPLPRKFGNYDDTLVYIQNCQPAFHWFKQETRTCKYDRICPFCYARRIGKLWPLFTSALPPPVVVDPFGDDVPLRAIQLEETPPASSPFHLVERRNTADISFGIGSTETIDDQMFATMTEHLRTFLRERITVRSNMLQKLRPYGSYSQMTVEPRVSGWRLRVRQLFLVRPDDRIELQLPQLTRGVCFRHTDLSRACLLRTLASTCRYPAGMFRGNPLLTSIILRASAGLRLHATSGALRQQRALDD